jgi:hypothetical protein
LLSLVRRIHLILLCSKMISFYVVRISGLTAPLSMLLSYCYQWFVVDKFFQDYLFLVLKSKSIPRVSFFVDGFWILFLWLVFSSIMLCCGHIYSCNR